MLIHFFTILVQLYCGLWSSQFCHVSWWLWWNCPLILLMFLVYYLYFWCFFILFPDVLVQSCSVLKEKTPSNQFFNRYLVILKTSWGRSYLVWEIKTFWCSTCFIRNKTFRMRNKNFENTPKLLTSSWLVGFYGILTFIGYLMPNSLLFK